MTVILDSTAIDRKILSLDEVSTLVDTAIFYDSKKNRPKSVPKLKRSNLIHKETQRDNINAFSATPIVYQKQRKEMDTNTFVVSTNQFQTIYSSSWQTYCVTRNDDGCSFSNFGYRNGAIVERRLGRSTWITAKRNLQYKAELNFNLRVREYQLFTGTLHGEYIPEFHLEYISPDGSSILNVRFLKYRQKADIITYDSCSIALRPIERNMDHTLISWHPIEMFGDIVFDFTKPFPIDVQDRVFVAAAIAASFSQQAL